MAQTVNHSERDPGISPAVALVVELARARRKAYREVNAFCLEPGEITLRAAVEDHGNPEIDWEIAQGLLNEIDQRRLHIIQSLPALDDESGRPTGVTAAERFVAFVENDALCAIDLKRIEHTGDWDGANELDGQVDDLVRSLMTDPVLSEQYWCQRHEISEDTCSMHLYEIEPGMLRDGLLYVGRNTKKATFINNRNERMRINKRSELLVDLAKLSSDESRRIILAMAEQPNDGVVLTDGLFWRFNDFITTRHPAIIPVSSTAYVYRDAFESHGHDGQPDPLLDNYAELREAWYEAALQNGHGTS